VKKVQAQGAQAVHDHYRALFGSRWESLSAALAAEPDSRPFVAAPGLEPYFMDSASIFAASALELPERGLVLDACAAPGGKTLVLASRLGAESSARLVANELSSDRRRRLAAVLDSKLPPGLRARVEVSGRDAASLCRRMPGAYASILLDAPCSSERHVLADQSALAEWKASRIRGLAQRQWSLLSSAFLMLAPGGCLVYSTCALSPEENDGVVERLLDKRGGELAIEALSDARAEATAHGIRFLPDTAGGAGPMYVCRIRRLHQD
jgi:16S rRNA C967 or C1407 C5-methylase (RsmB/RsmF family)